MKQVIPAIAVSLLWWVMPAGATPTVDGLFRAIKNAGTSIVVDDPKLCKDPKLMGYYEYIPSVSDRIVVCVANHKGDSAELRDTVLHESVHVAQACAGGPLFSVESIVEGSKAPEVLSVVANYSDEQFHRELEARVIAREQDEVYITNLIHTHCK
jgi:hypothetical protein